MEKTSDWYAEVVDANGAVYYTCLSMLKVGEEFILRDPSGNFAGLYVCEDEPIMHNGTMVGIICTPVQFGMA